MATQKTLSPKEMWGLYLFAQVAPLAAIVAAGASDFRGQCGLATQVPKSAAGAAAHTLQIVLGILPLAAPLRPAPRQPIPVQAKGPRIEFHTSWLH